MSEGNLANLDTMTFLEFMAKLDRTIEKNEAEAKATQERINELKNRKNGR